MRLTKKQKELLDWVEKVNIPGEYQHKVGYFYCECEPQGLKPWNVKTVFSLIDRGLIELADDPGFDRYYNPNGVYALRPKTK